MVVPVSSYVSLGYYKREYEDWEPFSRWGFGAYEYDWDDDEARRWGRAPDRQRKIIFGSAEEISNRLECHLMKVLDDRVVGYQSREDSFRFNVQPGRDVDVLLWWGGSGNLLGQFPIPTIDHRDIEKDRGVLILGRLHYGLSEGP